MKAAWSIAPCYVLMMAIGSALAGCGAGADIAPHRGRAAEPIVAAQPSKILETEACSEVRALVCDGGAGAAMLAVAPSDCGPDVDALVGDLLACLARQGGACDEAGRLAVRALRGCAEEQMVAAPAAGDVASIQRARRFIEQWIEARRPWLAVGPLGLVPSPALARALAASALRRGDRDQAIGWLRATDGLGAESAEGEACLWAAVAPDLTAVPFELEGIARVAGASLAWGACAKR